ncbi:MAG TPA: DUF885 family protein, partial [Pseudonocardiaceae bacterium]|nr:DUF885 family protein [Pseudonocardiaceae bacterium]
FMTTRASLSPGTAATEVSRYCAWPTQAPAYLTGCLEIEDLRAHWLADKQPGERRKLRDFHDTLGGIGCPPLGLARRALLGTS